MEPARSIVQMLGGTTAVAAMVGVHRTRVWNWMQPRERGGTGGVIPMKHVPKLIDAGRAQGFDMPAEAFLPRSPAEVTE